MLKWNTASETKPCMSKSQLMSMSRTCGPVLGADVEDAVGVDVEHDVDLRHAARRRRDARQLELAQQVVVAGARALALVHLRHRAVFLVQPDAQINDTSSQMLIYFSFPGTLLPHMCACCPSDTCGFERMCDVN